MKRKRGHKKGKHKQSLAANPMHVNMEDCSVLEDQYDNAESDLEMEVKVPTPLELDKPGNRADGCTDPPPVQGRVKVKLKSSKLLEAQLAHSDAQTQSDTDRSSSHLSLEKQECLDKRNDGANLMLELQPTVSGNSSRKAGSINIKSSRSIGTSSTPSVSLRNQSDWSPQSTSDVHNIISESHQKQHKFPYQDPVYNEKELNTALMVIRKIMKMEAAEPFNAPVDPVALGIPDYFDIIETPMDFGTICNKLEQGRIYKNSEDVYKDVQYIWENCYRYNNKGDYIVDLMKRVKKNFMKYWTAAGLYNIQSNRTNVSEMENMVPSSEERVHVKDPYLKHKKRGRHGFNKHKSDCLCAVCVVRRRRKEREGNAKVVESGIEISDGNASQEFKQEETSIENHGSEDASSNLGHSPDPDADADMEEHDEKMDFEEPEKHVNPHEMKDEEIQKTGERPRAYKFQVGDGSGEEPNPRSQSEELEDSGIIISKDKSQHGNPWHQDIEAIEIQKLPQKQDSPMMQQQTVMCDNLLLDRNPWIMKLCGALFPNNGETVWSGPHSLGHRKSPVRRRTGGIHAAVEMLIKK